MIVLIIQQGAKVFPIGAKERKEKMLLFEAKEMIEERLKLKQEFKDVCPDYIEALEIAVKSIEKQIELADVLNDWNIEQEVERKDTYSALSCYDIVEQFSIFTERE